LIPSHRNDTKLYLFLHFLFLSMLKLSVGFQLAKREIFVPYFFNGNHFMEEELSGHKTDSIRLMYFAVLLQWYTFLMSNTVEYFINR